MATARQLEHPKADLYEQDFLAWVEDQAEALRTRQIGALDWDNLVEEIESMGASQRRELGSRLAVLLMHLVKWHWQPEKRSKSWQLTILEQRREIRRLLKASPSLQRFIPDEIPEAWMDARKAASTETDIPALTFPTECPWDAETQVLADWLPE
ncbi:MAG: DUF29 domain-containing protein [Acidithiobacillus sp.]